MATLSAAAINDLPDSDFLYIEPGGKKDSDGKTTPRSLRHFPVPDIAHVRNALARIPQSDLPADVKARARAKAEAMLAAMTKDDDDLEDTGWKSARPLSFSLDGAKEGDVLVAFAKADGTTIDSDGHITDPGAFPEKRVPISSYGHTSWPEKGARLPVGTATIGEEDGEARAKGAFLLDTTHGRDTYLTVKALDDLQEWSYGYRILAHSREKGASKSGIVLRLKKLDVREISPTLVGAGVDTRTMAIKSGDDEGPLAGLPYSEHLDRVLVEVEEIVGRSKALRNLRVKDGRELSETNRGKLSRLRDSIAMLEETKAELEELLARTDRTEPDAKAAGERLFAEYQATIASLNGVAVTIGG